MAPFQSALTDSGFIEGQSVTIDYRLSTASRAVLTPASNDFLAGLSSGM